MGIDVSRLRKFAEDVLTAAGADRGDASSVADVLIWADRVERTEQGVERLPILCRRLEAKLIRSPFEPTWDQPKGAFTRLDAHDGFGHLAGLAAAKKSIELAATYGIGAVTVSNSNYFGAAGYYAWLVAQAKMVGIAVSNSFPKVAAHGGASAVLGTNPFAFAAPVGGDEPLLLDMATAAVAGSEVRRRAAAGIPLDPGMAVDAQGQPLLDAAKFNQGAALAFGGAKGFGLMLLVETLAGVLSGGAIGTEVNSLYNDWSNPGRSCHFVLAIDPTHILPEGAFEERMRSLQAMLTASGPGVRLPGADRWQAVEIVKARGVDRANLPVEKLRELGTQYDVSTSFLDGA